MSVQLWFCSNVDKLVNVGQQVGEYGSTLCVWSM